MGLKDGCRAGGAVGGDVVAAVAERLSSVEMLRIEECDAWFEYLHLTRAQSSCRYDEVEPWAWGKLQARLTAIAARRRSLGIRVAS